MAFNFNWTPLSTTSSEFYNRAKDLLTTALNKAPKPPIIVDDIYVEELNLGSTAPELEILEIGDLAEDRFRGVFKLSYGGNAELTLKTKVQANPLSTYLSTTPSFTSPCPLAASVPLTIPLQITLSEFRLSGFVILVFSKAKGITLVFRNDPLESLRVSSTFDSIPFIKDYLQKEIERVVRGLFQEELPVGIHRLSLKWFNPDYAASLEAESNATQQSTTHPSFSGESEDETTASPYINPLATSPEDINQPQFSEKNLAKLETLLGSQKTLSVVSLSVSEAVFRAWATPSIVPAWSNGGLGLTDSPGVPAGMSTIYTFNDAGDAVAVMGSSQGGRSPSSANMSVPSAGTSSTTASVVGMRLGRGRKKKHRVVNLRRKSSDTTSMETLSDTTESTTDPVRSTAPTSVYSDEYDSRGGSKEGSIMMEEDDQLEHHSLYRAQKRGVSGGSMRRSGSLCGSPPPNQHLTAPSMMRDISGDTASSGSSPRRRDSSPIHSGASSTSSASARRISNPMTNPQTSSTSSSPSVGQTTHECRCRHAHQVMPNSLLNLASIMGAGGGGSILEQAVLMKLAREVARLQAKEKEREMEKDRERNRMRVGVAGDAPPAYDA